MQPSRRRGPRQRITRFCKMIDADLQKAVALEFLGDGLGLVDTLLRTGKHLLIDKPLIGLETRHVGVAVAGDAIRREHRDDLAGLAERGDGLQRQSVDQIQIADAGSPQPQNGRGDILHRLPPADRRLHHWIDVLHAKTDAVDTKLIQAARQQRRHIAGIELDGVLETGFKNEMPAQDCHHGCETLGPQNAGRSPTPVQSRNVNRRCQIVADQHNLVLQRRAIGAADVLAQRLLGMQPQ